MCSNSFHCVLKVEITSRPSSTERFEKQGPVSIEVRLHIKVKLNFVYICVLG